MVGAQAAKLLLEQLFHIFLAFDQIMGQLGGNEHPIPRLIALQDLTQSRLAAGVDVSGIEIIHTALNGGHDLPFGFLFVDDSGLVRKAHAAEPQNRKPVSVFIASVMHGNYLRIKAGSNRS